MKLTTLRYAVAAALVAATFAAPATARQPANDLFYNYYTGPVGHPAQMYPSPRPVPEFVGHTYYTYQPFLPHEFLYKPHARVYTKSGCRGILPQNRTTVMWW